MSERVRCKFVCTEKVERKGWNASQPILFGFKFQPVTSGSSENEAFYAATPSGSLEFATISRDLFEVGQEVYLDIVPA